MQRRRFDLLENGAQERSTPAIAYNKVTLTHEDVFLIYRHICRSINIQDLSSSTQDSLRKRTRMQAILRRCPTYHQDHNFATHKRLNLNPVRLF